MDNAILKLDDKLINDSVFARFAWLAWKNKTGLTSFRKSELVWSGIPTVEAGDMTMVPYINPQTGQLDHFTHIVVSHTMHFGGGYYDDSTC